MDKIDLGERNQPEYSVIWLHGLGADGNDFVPIISALQLPQRTHYVLPHAPFRPVSIHGGIPLRAWFGIETLDESGPIDKPGIEETVTRVNQLITAEMDKGVNPQNIILAGFSQGGVIAIHAGLRFPQQLGGIIALSTYLPLAQELAQIRHQANLTTPIFVAHGNQDLLVPYHFGKKTAEILQQWGNPVNWHEYVMQHSVCEHEIGDIAQWLKKIL